MKDIQNITKLLTSFEIILDFLDGEKKLKKGRIESLMADIHEAQEFLSRFSSVRIRKVMSAIDEDSI